MTLSFWQRSSRAPARSCDCAVVGGGILGCSAAFWLGRLAPQTDVLLLEAETLASGATGRNAGFLLQGVAPDYATDYDTLGPEKARRLWQFTHENRTLIERELDAAAIDLEPSGSILAAGSEAEAERLERSVRLLREIGAEAMYLEPETVNSRLHARGFHGGAYLPSGAAVHPVKLVRHLAAQSEAVVLEHHKVLSWEEDHGRILLETPQCRIRCDRLLVCAGADISLLQPELASLARPVRAQMLSVEASTSHWLEQPVYSHDGYFYVRQVPGGPVLAGGARHLHRDEEVGRVDKVTSALQSDLEAYLHDFFPRTRELRVTNRWSGTMSFSPDRLPVVGTLPGLSQSWWAAGCTGHGLAYGFLLGRLLAERLLYRHEPERLRYFSVSRFDREAEPTDRR